jgi:hypothetical protein
VIEAYERMAAFRGGGRVIGVAINSRRLTAAEADAERERGLALGAGERGVIEASLARLRSYALGQLRDIDAPAAPTPSDLVELLPEHASEVLDWAAHCAGNQLVTCVLKDVVNVLRVYTLPALGGGAAAPLWARPPSWRCRGPARWRPSAAAPSCRWCTSST